MSDLVTFLRARLDEDEAVARAIDDKQIDSGWSASYNQYGVANTPPGWYITPHIGLTYEEEGAAHIARHDPARVLREVEAKRRIMKDYLISDSAVPHSDEGAGRRNLQGGADAFHSALVTLATVYSDHPDYRQDWLP